MTHPTLPADLRALRLGALKLAQILALHLGLNALGYRGEPSQMGHRSNDGSQVAILVVRGHSSISSAPTRT